MSFYEKLRQHVGHNLTVVDYGDGLEYSVECEDCHEVIISEEHPDAADPVEQWKY